jgi:hypothetical protein
MRRIGHHAALVAATVAWGVEIVVGKYAVGGIGAFSTLFVESGTAATFLWILMLFRLPRRTVRCGTSRSSACWNLSSATARSTWACGPRVRRPVSTGGAIQPLGMGVRPGDHGVPVRLRLVIKLGLLGLDETSGRPEHDAGSVVNRGKVIVFRLARED